MMTNSFFICESEFNNIASNAKSFENVETGGMLFGKIDRFGNFIVIKVLNPVDNCERKIAFFKLEEDYASSITKDIEHVGLDYLGNWHKHMGYGGPSKGDDLQAKCYFENNKHKTKLVSLIFDLHDPLNYDLYPVAYESKDGRITKKYLNFTILPRKKFKNLAQRYSISLNISRAILDQIEKNTGIKCKLLDRQLTHEYIIQIPIIYNKLTKSSNVDRQSFNSLKEILQFFVYLSMPQHTFDMYFTKDDKILIGISSIDYSFDMSICKMPFDYAYRPSIILKVIQKIIENIDKCMTIPLPQYLLKGAY